MAKLSIKIDGLNEYINKLNQVGGNVHKAIENALIESHELITKQVKDALAKGVPLKNGGRSNPIDMYKSNGTGNMAKSFMDEPYVNWFGDRAIIQVGFNQSISQHATYMMITGTAYTKPSTQLYNAIYGKKTKEKVAEIQKNALERAIEEAMK
jgi:hypothetical protein